MSASITQEFVQTNGIKMHYVTAGKGPLVILLHGFPQFWYTWRHQIPELAKHFQVVAPDLRGYGDTDKPQQISDYRGSLLADDIVGLIHGLGHTKAHVVGHDWGGAVAWRMAISHPEAVDRLVVLNCPHPYKFAKADFRQLLRSWYVFFFQLPYIPEFLFRMAPGPILNKLFRGSLVRKETFTDEDVAKYLEAMKKPGAMTAAMNYYRAVLRRKEPEDLKKKIQAPTLLIWAENDVALGKKLTYDMESLFSGSFRLEYIPNCSHWVNEEQPELVNRLLVEFLGSK